MPDFHKSLENFVAGVQRISDEHMAQHFPGLRKPVFELQELRKRYRIVREGSAHCFVDKTTGDVLKSESWSKPAKHARGNIFDDSNGLGRMGPYGTAYLR